MVPRVYEKKRSQIIKDKAKPELIQNSVNKLFNTAKQNYIKSENSTLKKKRKMNDVETEKKKEAKNMNTEERKEEQSEMGLVELMKVALDKERMSTMITIL